MKSLIFFKFFIISIVLIGCSSDSSSDSSYKSTFSVRIDAVESYLEQTEDERYPYSYVPYLVMENMPAGEYVISNGGCFSHTNPVPNESDYCDLEGDYDKNELFREWDWSQPLIWAGSFLEHDLLPLRDYYYRGRVETNKGVYYSNVIALRSEKTAPLVDDPTAYEIPIIFHVPIDSTQNNTERVQDWLEFANMVFSNYYDLPHLADADIRFVPALQDPDGNPLETPGMHYYSEELHLDNFDVVGNAPLWNMEKALNVWIAPFYNMDAAGISTFPYFDPDEILPGMDVYPPDSKVGIFINDHYDNMRNDNMFVFAHEAGHFLGLIHVFETATDDDNDYCADTLFYDRDEYTLLSDYYYFKRPYPDNSDTFFLSDNIMDYDFSYYSGITPDQRDRVQFTLNKAYFIPGEKGKTETLRNSSVRKFGRLVE